MRTDKFFIDIQHVLMTMATTAILVLVVSGSSHAQNPDDPKDWIENPSTQGVGTLLSNSEWFEPRRGDADFPIAIMPTNTRLEICSKRSTANAIRRVVIVRGREKVRRTSIPSAGCSHLFARDFFVTDLFAGVERGQGTARILTDDIIKSGSFDWMGAPSGDSAYNDYVISKIPGTKRMLVCVTETFYKSNTHSTHLEIRRASNNAKVAFTVDAAMVGKCFRFLDAKSLRGIRSRNGKPSYGNIRGTFQYFVPTP